MRTWYMSQVTTQIIKEKVNDIVDCLDKLAH